MDEYQFVQLLMFLFSIAGGLGYAVLFALLFRSLLVEVQEPIRWTKRSLLWGLTAVAVPPIAAWTTVKAAQFFGVRFHYNELGSIAGSSLFSLLTLPVMFVFFWVIRQSCRRSEKEPNPEQNLSEQFKQQQSQKQGKMAACGCGLPLLLLFLLLIIFGCLGGNLNHDYNPYMDGPEPILLIGGINILQSLGMCLVFCIFLGALVFWFGMVIVSFDFKRKSFQPPDTPPRTVKSRIIEYIIVIAIIGLIAGLLLPAAKASRYASRYSSGIGRNLVFAMRAYHEKYNSYPPAYTVDSEGKPLHSWRVLILPYLGHAKKLYEKIRLDEPWDSEYNRQFHTPTDEFFPNYPFESITKRTHRRFDFGHYSDFSVIVGSSTPFPGSECCSQTDIADPKQTLMFIERAEPVCWMDPTQELTRDQFLHGNGISTRGDVWFVSCDEYTNPQKFNKNLSPTEKEKLADRNNP